MGCGFAWIQVKKESRDSAESPKLAFAGSDMSENCLLLLGHQAVLAVCPPHRNPRKQRLGQEIALPLEGVRSPSCC